MKSYPSIDNKFRAFQAYIFDKIDGSNLRFEYLKKRGWYKFGTRNRLFDETDPVFGEAINLFFNKCAPGLTKRFEALRIDRGMVFMEFAGPSSFAGQHIDEPKKLYLIDVAIYKKGLVSPLTLIRDFYGYEYPCAAYLGRWHWGPHLLELVYANKLNGVTFEGIVGKAGAYHERIMAKAKTEQWINKVRALYEPKTANKLISS